MKRLSANELRRSFLEFFREREHAVVPSDSLVPAHDPTLLFTGAGMNQFKDDFLGKGTRPYKRATSSQKCLRTQDLEVVGKTYFHHTFFEMLGNFSFGDYFKREAILWAWEYSTKVLEIPPERIAVSVYLDDDEAYNVWADEVGVPKERIYRFGAKDNYWPANSPNDEAYRGPCGPCSELFYDFGEEYGPPGEDPSGESGRFCEFWNLVFQQFEKIGPSPDEMVHLPQPGIDTGAGFERILALLHGVRSNFETPLLRPLVDKISEFAGLDYVYESREGEMIRRIADHVRAAVFCIADGVWPDREGRGYVLRKIIRRAVRDGRQIGIDRVFLTELSPQVIELYAEPYPELGEKGTRDLIEKVLRSESEAFRKTLDNGEARISHYLEHPEDPAWIAPLPADYKLEASRRKTTIMVRKGEKQLKPLPPAKHLSPRQGGVLSGEVVFDLEQTYGFPGDVTKFILAERGYGIDEIGYDYWIVKHALVSGPQSSVKDVFDKSLDLPKERIGRTEFVGYTQTEAEIGGAEYLLTDDAGNEITELAEGSEANFFAKRTPFYAESGGQVADTGWIRVTENNGSDKARLRVIDCQMRGELYQHRVVASDGTVQLFAKPSLQLVVDATRRDDVRRHHTATHLVHHALRCVLGEHVHQKGSLVAPDRLRFDFTHPEALTPSQIEAVEAIANEIVFHDDAVLTEVSTPEEAKRRGAMALFGEKYGDEVRVVACGPTLELCGGTHVKRAGEIGGIRLVSQAASASGVRRIEALTGPALLRYEQEERRRLAEAAEKLKTTPEKLPEAIEKLQRQIKEAREEAKKARSQASTSVAPVYEDKDSGVRAYWLPEDTPRDALKALADDEANRLGNARGVILAVAGPAFVAKASTGFTEQGGHVGNLVKEHGAAYGIRGGGSKQFVQGKAPSEKGQLIAFATKLAEQGVRA